MGACPGHLWHIQFPFRQLCLPANPKNQAATIAWLTVAASKAGQEAFNPLKGSICARTDCDQSLFSEYSQGAAKDWTKQHAGRQPLPRCSGCAGLGDFDPDRHQPVPIGWDGCG